MSPAEQCAHATADILQSLPKARIAVSGGSTPRRMFSVLATLPVKWQNVDLYWVDERCVPPDHPDSNYRMTRESLLEVAEIPEANVHRIAGELPPEQGAAAYEAQLPDQFDLILMGVGEDAHTASLFPGEPMIDDRHRKAAALWVAKKDMWRITLLPRLLLSATHSFVLASGEDKRTALQNVLSAPVEPRRYPAQLVLRLRQSRLFTDLAGL